ncbi:hypothetical protein HC251_09095 [Iamia sp. SCSIO 61187]|uniref:hypothetical protein n=1 Tax=Iamia sp. SCSIO 61187 TaxID=2722752 RepID=UPI001C627100|nr:hypothetical protein [Iamia sp. SCSIO 61187]QYG92577.1 hypothetical protein HC251_09095 [Iamia sp. SCSIO 61187]
MAVPLTAIPARRGARVVVVAGPGATGARRGLRTLAGITGATVVNTVGAKGLLAWDDPLHGGTVGLQEGDAELAELLSADLVVTTGVDLSESVSLTAALQARGAAEPGSVVDVHPAHLALAAGGWPPADGPGARPPFYDAVAAVVGPLYQQEGTAAWAAARLAADLPPGGLVVAPPGPTGFWIGRTFPTAVAGSVVVPTGAPVGTAEGLALAAAGEGRPTTLVTTEPVDLDGVTVEAWPRAMTHGDALDALVAVSGRPDEAIWPGWSP